MWLRAVKTLGLTLLVVVGLFYYWTERITDPSLLRGATKIEIRSTAGAVEIAGSDKNDVEVMADGQSASARGVHVQIDRDHGPMRVSISNIPQNTQVEIRVPSDAALSVNMSAGQLRIHGVRGDIGSLLRSGRMVVEVQDTQKMQMADASVLAGEVKAPVFQRDKGGLFRRFVWHGSGSTNLRAHVTTGQLLIQ